MYSATSRSHSRLRSKDLPVRRAVREREGPTNKSPRIQMTKVENFATGGKRAAGGRCYTCSVRAPEPLFGA